MAPSWNRVRIWRTGRHTPYPPTQGFPGLPPPPPVCDSPDCLQDETNYLNNVFSKNNYNKDFVRRNTHSNTDSNTHTSVNSGPVTKVSIPYIRGTSETIARILQSYNIRVAHRPITTLRRLVLTNVKDKDKPEDRQEAVYKIKCGCDCQASYIGETGRNLSTRLTEHKRSRQERQTSTITLLNTIYRRNIKSAGTLRHVLRILQTTITTTSWFTNLEQTPLNHSQQLPAPYKRLIDEI